MLGTTAEKISHVHPHIMDSDSPEDAQAVSEDDFVQREEDGTFLSCDFLFQNGSSPYIEG